MDEEEIFPVLCPKKTYSKPFKKVTRTVSESDNMETNPTPRKKIYDPSIPLTTKVAVEYLLNGKLKTSVCRYCLKVTVGLSEVDQMMQIAGEGVLYKVSIREMIACFYPVKAIQDENFPEKICQRCVDRALNAYLFTQQCEQADRALHNCFDDINEKFIKLDPIDRPKKRGRQKLHPNHNKLYVEHSKVIDYAEPLRNIINLQTESLSKEPAWNEFECKRCWQVLPDLESLLNHEQIHPKYMWYHCRLCGKSFVKQNQLKRHFNQVHVKGKDLAETVDKTFKCLECGNVTENYVQHLQHVEKHKFQSVMKHLIEKKTDQLCLVCLKKCTDLVELDKMVCIHGNCPELAGDKTLYTVLASTLPDKKSYKYQELHVPHKADIMTITKRKRKYSEIKNVPQIIAEGKYILSAPKIITRDKFKTDDFYYYVFCEPGVDEFIISTIDNNSDTPDIKSPRIYEINDEETMDCNIDDTLTDSREEMSLFENFGAEDTIMSTKELVTVARKYNPVTDIVIRETQPSSSFRRGVHNYGENITGYTESVGMIIQGYAAGQIQPDDEDEEYIDYYSGHFNFKDDYCNVKSPMKKKDMLFNEVTEPSNFIVEDNPDNSQDRVEKYPTNIDEQNHSKEELENLSSDLPKPSMLQFSNPITIEFDENINNKNNELIADMTTTYKFSNPDHVDISNKEVKEIDIRECDNVPMKVKTALNCIFTSYSTKSVLEDEEIDDVTNVIDEPHEPHMTDNDDETENDCKFCWLFKHLTKCEYCKKPIEKDAEITEEDKEIIEKKTNTDTPIDEENVGLPTNSKKVEKHDVKPKTQKSWQCHVCLINNDNNRSACQCCESKKYTEDTEKVTFGKNKSFFINMLDKETNLEKKDDKSIKNPTPFVIIDEETMMETKSTVQDDILTQIDNIIDSNSTHSMDIEMDSVNYVFNTKAPLNEDMDVEEEPTPLNTAQKFDPTTYFATNIGTNLQFNIGAASSPSGHEKGARKFVKAVRKMPKAFHK